MAKSLKYYTLPKSKVTIWEKPLKAGGVFYYLYLDQTQILSSQVDEVVKIIRERLPNSAVMGKKTAKTYQISYSLPNGEKAQGVDETMLEFVDDKLQEFGYDDTKNQAVSTRGKKMIGTYATGSSTIKFVTPSQRVWKVGDEFHTEVDKSDIRKIISIGNGVVYIRNANGSVGEWTDGVVDTFFKHGTWILNQPPVLTPYEVGDEFYAKTNTNYKFNITLITESVVKYTDEDGSTHIINKLDFENKLSSGEIILEKKSSTTKPPVTQSQIPEIKTNQFYIDTFNYSLIVIDSVTDNFVYYRQNFGSGIVSSQASKQEFIKSVQSNSYKLYLPEGGQEWIEYDSNGDKVTSFRILNYDSAKNYVKFSSYDNDDKYVTTNTFTLGVFTETIVKYGMIYTPSSTWSVGDYFYHKDDKNNKFLIESVDGNNINVQLPRGNFTQYTIQDADEYFKSGKWVLTPPPVSQAQVPEIKYNQFYIDFENKGKLLLVELVENNDVHIREDYEPYVKGGFVISRRGFEEKISDGKIKLYIPEGGDEWTRFDPTTLKPDSVFRVLTNAKGKVEYAVYDSEGNYVMTDNDDEYTFKNYLLNNNFQFTTPLQSLQEKKSEQKVETEKYETKYSEKSKLKKELKDLVELKDLISDLDFEDKVNVSTLITKTQNKINDIIAKEVEKKIGDTKIFEELFEQSFTPLQSRYDMKMEKNDLVELVAPNGEMSDLNEDVTNLVNSELFKEWFGDFKTAYFYRNLPDFGGIRVSKVLSEKFEPLVVWHGTGKQFSYFRFDNFPAAYFAVNRKYSDFFAKVHSEDGVGYVLPFFININNPLDLSFFGNEKVSSKDFFDWMYLKTGMTPEQLEINPLMLDSSMPPVPIWVYLRNNPTMLKKLADMGVYDGIKFYEFNPNVDPNDEAYSTLAYITFDPHQSKLADPDRGQILLASLKSFMLEKGGSV